MSDNERATNSFLTTDLSGKETSDRVDSTPDKLADRDCPVVAIPTYSKIPSPVEMQYNHVRIRQGLDYIINSMCDGVDSIVFKQGETVLGTISTLEASRKVQ